MNRITKCEVQENEEVRKEVSFNIPEKDYVKRHNAGIVAARLMKRTPLR